MRLFESFKRHRRERPDAPAFLIASGDRSMPVSWRRFTDDIETVAHLIRKNAPGSVIGILGENSYEWMVAHAACLFSGATVVPVEVTLSPEEIASRLVFTEARVLICSSLYVEKANEVKALVPGLILGGFGTRLTDEFLAKSRKELDAEGGGIFSEAGPDVSKTSMIVFTSGTTSEPKGVELAISNIEAFCEWTVMMLPMHEGEHSLMALPLHHIFGMAATYLMLAKGVALGVCPDFRRLYDAVERFHAEFVFVVPALADILAEKIRHRAELISGSGATTLRWVLVGGAPMSKKTETRLANVGVKAVTGYGLTETCALYSMSPLDEPFRSGSAGRVAGIPGVETSVSDRGELLIRGGAVMKGYFKDPEATSAAIDADGWLHTGDSGRIDGDGILWITGRLSRTIILSSGKKVAPEELEARLLDIPGIKEAFVSGDGESRIITAQVYSELSSEEIHSRVAAMNGSLPVFKRINDLVIRMEPFPRTSSGKIKAVAAKRHSPPSRWALAGRVRRRSFAALAALSLCGVVLAVVDITLTLLEGAGVAFPRFVSSGHVWVDVVAAILLGTFAVMSMWKIRSEEGGRR